MSLIMLDVAYLPILYPSSCCRTSTFSDKMNIDKLTISVLPVKFQKQFADIAAWCLPSGYMNVYYTSGTQVQFTVASLSLVLVLDA